MKHLLGIFAKNQIKKFIYEVIRAFCLCWLLMLADGVSAQLVDKVLSVLGEDSVGSVTVARTDSDSIQLSLVRQELETARLNEANLRMEMEQMKLQMLPPTP